VLVSVPRDSTQRARQRAAGWLALAWSLALAPIALAGVGIHIPGGVRVGLWVLFAVALLAWLVTRRRERRGRTSG
jgi:hypothetical protein